RRIPCPQKILTVRQTGLPKPLDPSVPDGIPLDFPGHTYSVTPPCDGCATDFPCRSVLSRHALTWSDAGVPMIPMQNARRHPRFAARLAVIVLATVATAAHQPHASTSQFPARPAALSFSGLVDADFVSEFGDDFGTLRHITGLKLDLATTVTFSPTVAAVIQTTMNDGAVPAQGAGNTWATVRFDGVTLNWKYGDHTVIHIGDLRPGTGYFNYYRNKHTAVVVGEHALRGVGISRSGWTVATGATGLGATDTAGNPVASSQWSTFARYDYRIAAGVTLTPSLRYTAGVPGA